MKEYVTELKKVAFEHYEKIKDDKKLRELLKKQFPEKLKKFKGLTLRYEGLKNKYE